MVKVVATMLLRSIFAASVVGWAIAVPVTTGDNGVDGLAVEKDDFSDFNEGVWALVRPLDDMAGLEELKEWSHDSLDILSEMAREGEENARVGLDGLSAEAQAGEQQMVNFATAKWREMNDVFDQVKEMSEEEWESAHLSEALEALAERARQMMEGMTDSFNGFPNGIEVILDEEEPRHPHQPSDPHQPSGPHPPPGPHHPPGPGHPGHHHGPVGPPHGGHRHGKPGRGGPGQGHGGHHHHHCRRPFRRVMKKLHHAIRHVAVFILSWAPQMVFLMGSLVAYLLITPLFAKFAKGRNERVIALPEDGEKSEYLPLVMNSDQDDDKQVVKK